ncbi:MAG: hypothetical protein AAGA75_15775 [Cyanobacteria bacterium P01_E01_bin.6]
MWFLAPLITALGAVFVYDKCERSSAEIAIICVAVALGSIILTIVVAPWPIQLALAAILVAFRVARTREVGIW